MTAIGKALYDAAQFGDVYLILAGAMVAVVVAVLSQFISDIGYTFLNPAHPVRVRSHGDDTTRRDHRRRARAGLRTLLRADRRSCANRRSACSAPDPGPVLGDHGDLRRCPAAPRSAGPIGARSAQADAVAGTGRRLLTGSAPTTRAATSSRA